jgi:hypothetical protein
LQINYELRRNFKDFYPLRCCFFVAPAKSLTVPGLMEIGKNAERKTLNAECKSGMSEFPKIFGQYNVSEAGVKP